MSKSIFLRGKVKAGTNSDVLSLANQNVLQKTIRPVGHVKWVKVQLWQKTKLTVDNITSKENSQAVEICLRQEISEEEISTLGPQRKRKIPKLHPFLQKRIESDIGYCANAEHEVKTSRSGPRTNKIAQLEKN